MIRAESVAAKEPVSIRSLDDFMNQFLPETARKERAEQQNKVDINARKIADAVLAAIAPKLPAH